MGGQKMGLHDGHRQRMRQQFLSHGPQSMADHELLELALFYAIPRRDTNETAHRLLEQFGSLDRVLTAPEQELEQVEGVGQNAAVLLRLKKLETNDQLLVLLLVAMLAVCGISYAYFHEYYLYFWLMNMPVAIAVMAVELKTEDFRLPGARQLLGVVLAGCFTVCAVNTVRQEIENPYLAHKGLDAAADWLVDNGYTEGYATFWNGNAMTELTNGKLDVWTLQSLDEDYVPNWLQRKDHLTTDPQHPFLLIDTETDGPAESAGLVQNGECTEVYNDGRFVIYDFAGADAVHAAAK